MGCPLMDRRASGNPPSDGGGLCDDRHNAIESQIAALRLPIPNGSFPQNGKTNRVVSVRGADFTIFEN
jgi:hypothetical protein